MDLPQNCSTDGKNKKQTRRLEGEDPKARKAGRRTKKQLRFQKRNSIVLPKGVYFTLLPDLVANIANSSKLDKK